MVAECAGLPLAIVVIAGSMRGLEEISDWRNALRELRQCVVDTEKDSEDEIFNRLKFSYDRLPKNSSIKECFLYCSLYPEDWNIRRKDLIENWICEGTVQKLGSRGEMHDKGNTILNRLLNCCLLEEAYDKACVKMHDVVRDMALRIKSTGPGWFMVKAGMRLTEIPNEDEWNGDLNKVSLMKNEISYIPQNMSPKCLMLSTLILEGNNGLRQISECFLANMPQLKFLDLSRTGIEVLPNSICNLEYLTALILRKCCCLKHMPSLSKLKALKKLDLEGAGLHETPEGIEMLENLEYLDLSCPNLTELPRGKISKLFRLQYLRKHRIFATEIGGKEVAGLKMLEWFEGTFDWLKDYSSFVSKLNHFGRPSHYSINVGTAIHMEGYFLKFNNNDLPKQVILIGYQMEEGDEFVLPNDLQDLTIQRCKMASDISIFQRDFTQLRTCALKYCQGIVCVVSLSSSSSTSLTVMNNLEVLTLKGLPDLRNVVKVEKTRASLAPTICPHIFSNLKQLRVFDCPKLKKLFPCELLQGQGLQNLELIKVNRCGGMEEIIGWEEEEEGDVVKVEKTRASLAPTICPHIFSNLKQLRVSDCPKLKKLFPCELLQGQGLQNLELIEVNRCGGMEEIIGWEEEEKGDAVKVEKTRASLAPTICPHIFPNLKQLMVYNCSKLKKLFPCELLQGQGLQNLELIDVKNCCEIEEIIGWEEEEEGDVVEVEKTRASLAPTISPHIFSNLKQLRVYYCSKLKKLFPCELLQGQGLQNLELIEVNHCGGMEEIIGWEEEEEGNQTTTPILITLPKLRKLELRFLGELKRICPERGVMVCESLNSIHIDTCAKVKRIPLCLGRENAQPSLPAVKSIYIFNPIEWWESLEWENPDDKIVLLPFLTYYERG
ncbi:hypothetical protein SLEP1_g36611 [Rubroshorea leprosula]|uniref:NB-ARC domain-containing protein n=1 Tax=Rubroshorea leprosula TaxID=152421 RepID=A0AAV5KS06_9ROSI|nr:hypothetical protein SLEP1_g36611 [Rubroshorea leprosula]